MASLGLGALRGGGCPTQGSLSWRRPPLPLPPAQGRALLPACEGSDVRRTQLCRSRPPGTRETLSNEAGTCGLWGVGCPLGNFELSPAYPQPRALVPSELHPARLHLCPFSSAGPAWQLCFGGAPLPAAAAPEPGLSSEETQGQWPVWSPRPWWPAAVSALLSSGCTPVSPRAERRASPSGQSPDLGPLPLPAMVSSTACGLAQWPTAGTRSPHSLQKTEKLSLLLTLRSGAKGNLGSKDRAGRGN